jgi:hypothetical protein
VASEAPRKPSDIGSRLNPIRSGDRPWLPAMNAYTNMKPPKVMNTGAATSRPIRTVRNANSSGGSSGSPPRRCSRSCHRTSAARATGAAMRQTQVHSGQPVARPSVSGKISSVMVAPSSTAPTQSSDVRAGALVSGRYRTTPIITSSATGALIQNTERQPRSEPARLPPTRNASEVDSPAVAANQPSARVRWCPSELAWMLASTCGESAAADRPCRNRAATS